MNSGHNEAGLRCDLIGLALIEDLGDQGDITSQAFIPASSTSLARIARCLLYTSDAADE